MERFDFSHTAFLDTVKGISSTVLNSSNTLSNEDIIYYYDDVFRAVMNGEILTACLRELCYADGLSEVALYNAETVVEKSETLSVSTLDILSAIVKADLGNLIKAELIGYLECSTIEECVSSIEILSTVCLLHLEAEDFNGFDSTIDVNRIIEDYVKRAVTILNAFVEQYIVK